MPNCSASSRSVCWARWAISSCWRRGDGGTGAQTGWPDWPVRPCSAWRSLGLVFSIYLTYLELFVIHAVCIWCLSSAVIMALLMLLTLPAATQWVAVSDEEEE